MMSSTSNFTRNEDILTKCLLSYIVESPSELYINSIISASVINAVFFIIGCTLNSLVVVIYSMLKQLRSKLTYFPVLVLCSVDLVTVTLVHPLFLMQAIAEVLGSPKCPYKIVYFSAMYILPVMSASTLLVMNVKRYIAVVWPLRHLQISRKKKKFMLACMLFWLLVAANFVCRLYKPRYSQVFIMVCAVIASFLTLIMHSSMFYVSRQRRSLSNSTEDSSRNQIDFIHNLKIAKIYFLVVILSLICFLPTTVMAFAVKYPWLGSESRRSLIARVYMWASTIASMNSTLNCLGFFWANARLRKEAWNLWRRFFPSKPATSRANATSSSNWTDCIGRTIP